MTFGDVFKLLGLDIEIDEKSRTWDLVLGPLRIKSVPFRTPNLLIGDRRMIGELLSECFIERRVMWKDLRLATPLECLSSLDELRSLLQQNVAKLEASAAEKDKMLAETLDLWKARAVLAQKEMKDVLDIEKQVSSSIGGGAASATENPACILEEVSPVVQFRVATLPTVGFLIDLLPDGDPVKSEAQTLRSKAHDDLVRYYSVRVDQLQHPDWQLSNAASLSAADVI